MFIKVPPAVEVNNSTSFEKKDGFHIMKRGYRVPLDYGNPEKDRIVITVRILFKNDVSDIANPLQGKDVLVYLCGGPGSNNPATKQAEINNFLLRKKAKQCVMYMDYRGTGDSTDFGKHFETSNDVDKQVHWLKLLLQDNIARDHEAVRQALGVKRFVLWGQSFGGFIVYSYASLYPYGGQYDPKRQGAKPNPVIKYAVTTGGVPPIDVPVDMVYQQTYKKNIELNMRFYERFKNDRTNVCKILAFINQQNQKKLEIVDKGLLDGTLTGRRFLAVGRTLGGTNGFAKVHEAIGMCIQDIDGPGKFQKATLEEIETLKFRTRPLYALLQEAIYMGPGQSMNNSALRVGKGMDGYGWLQDGGLHAMHKDANFGQRSIFMSSEHVYPFHFEDYTSLKTFKQAYDILAGFDQWPAMYDTAQLEKNTIPIVSLSFTSDPYVDFALAKKTVARVSCVTHLTIENIGEINKKIGTQTKPDELMHTSVKDRTNEVMDALWHVLQGKGLEE